MTRPHDWIEMVMVDQGEGFRPVGIISQEELEELERMHDAGDIRAEARLKLIREGRPSRERALVAPEPRHRWDSVASDPAADIARASGETIEQVWRRLRGEEPGGAGKDSVKKMGIDITPRAATPRLFGAIAMPDGSIIGYDEAPPLGDKVAAVQIRREQDGTFTLLRAAVGDEARTMIAEAKQVTATPSCAHPPGEVYPMEGMDRAWTCLLCMQKVPAPADPAARWAEIEASVSAAPLVHRCGACGRGEHANCSGWCRCGCDEGKALLPAPAGEASPAAYPTDAEVRANIEKVRAQGGRRAEVADLLDALLDNAQVAEAAPEGVTPIGGSRAEFKRLMGKLREAAMPALLDVANDGRPGEGSGS